MFLFRNAFSRDRSKKTRPAGSRARPRRVQFESLELRQLFTASTVPFTIINNTTLDSSGTLAYSNSEIHVALYAQQYETGDFYYFDASGNATLTSTVAPIGQNPPMVPAFLLNALTPQNGNFVINLPLNMPNSQYGPQSARMYFAMDVDPQLQIVSGGNVSAMIPNDNYFDFFEFTLNAPNNPVGNLNIDTTSVDQFGFPIQVEVESSDLAGGSQTVGIDATRQSVLDQFTTFTATSGDPYAICLWPMQGPYGNYRILNPSGLFDAATIQNTSLQVRSVLQVGMNSTVTTVNVYCAAAFPDPAQGPFTIQIDNEQMTVTAASPGLGTTTNWTVTRGVNGTNATSHSSSTLINIAGPAISATQTNLTMSNITGYPDPNSASFYVLVDSEVMQVTAASPQNVDGTTTWTVSRGQFGTTAATHANFALVYYNSMRDNALNGIFNSAIDALFSKYLASAATPLKLTLVSAQDHNTYEGQVVNADPQDITSPFVLRFTQQGVQNGQTYDVYYPFFEDNNYFWGGYTPALSIAAAPADLIAADVSELSPSNMVFSCSGVFADSAERAGLSLDQQKVLADLENQVVSALNRGVALLDASGATSWQDPSTYYGNNSTGQAWNHYAQFLHQDSVSLDGMNYGFAYDDQDGQASDIGVGSFTGVTATLTAWDDIPGPPAPPPPPGDRISLRDFMWSRIQSVQAGATVGTQSAAAPAPASTAGAVDAVHASSMDPPETDLTMIAHLAAQQYNASDAALPEFSLRSSLSSGRRRTG